MQDSEREEVAYTLGDVYKLQVASRMTEKEREIGIQRLIMTHLEVTHSVEFAFHQIPSLWNQIN